MPNLENTAPKKFEAATKTIISAEISKIVTLPNYLFNNLDANEADARLAKLLTLPIVVIIQFSLNRRVTFQQRTTDI